MEQHPIKINKVQIRNLQIEDYVQLSQSFTRVYSDGSDVFWTREQIQKLIKIFPEGQIVTVVDDKIVGCALSIIVDYDKVKNDHTYAQVTGKETFNTHNPKGNILYGIEVFIHPGYRGLRLARRMYEYRKELCETLNLKAIMFGGRIPNYHKYADKMRPKEYIERVRQREIYDPVLTFQLSNDFHVRKVMTNYLPNDEESKHYACLLQWDNIYYQPPTQEYISPKTTVRVGLVQWQMRSYKTLDDLFEQVEFFVDAVSDYKSDATKALEEIIEKNKTPIVVGGTGLYVNSLIYGIDYPEVETDLEYRKELEKVAEQKGLGYLYEEAKKIDPEAVKNISVNDKKRIIRILEIYKETGKTKTQLEIESRKNGVPYDYRVFAINMPREILYDRINRRVDIMLEKGLIEEVKQLYKKYGDELRTSVQGIGYKEVIDYLNGMYSKEEMIEKIKMETRRYAKRQLTWFRKIPNIIWIDGLGNVQDNVNLILKEAELNEN